MPEPDFEVDCSSASEVVAYLMHTYDMELEDAARAVQDHPEIVDRGISFRSRISYIGDEVAKAVAES